MGTVAGLAIALMIAIILAFYQPLVLLFLVLLLAMLSPRLRSGIGEIISILDLVGIVFDILSLL